MKIARFRYRNEKMFGCVDPQKGTVTKLDGSIFGDYYLTERTIDLNNVQLLAPVIPPNIIAVGLNYSRHARESGHQIPQKPVIFLKATTSLTGPGTRINLPLEAPEEVDYEAELAVIIGKKARHVEPEDAGKYILGYTCANDVSARDCQKKYDEQWARAKSFDTFCPLGPWFETEKDPSDLRIRSILNGDIMQESRTSDMIFGPREIVSYCSRNMTLLPGTVIITGTPEGVGMARKPPVYLREGDQIKIEIEGIGTLENTAVREEEPQKKGQKFIRTWQEKLGTTQITPTMLDKIKSFIEDGMEEELIVQILDYSVSRTEGNPFNYLISILNDYINQGIYTVDDYENYIQKEGDDGAGIPGINRKEETGTPRQDLEELYKKGYR